MHRRLVLAACAALSLPHAHAAEPAEATAGPSSYDAALAASVGADERGMRSYVFVILKTGPVRVPDGPERDAMFRGHFANMQRLSDAGKLAYAGPLDGVDGRRGVFILATADLEEAKQLVATDPVIVQGEMVAEYHKHYGSAALMLVRDAHKRISSAAP